MNENKAKLTEKTEDFKENISSDITRKEIEKSYDIDLGEGTEAYFSDRYGWTLRKPIK
mgnify:FL=1|tara:strand:- start:318 stop:491 length:174 start_codon:yes stop_codon:yes gene_type:complete